MEIILIYVIIVEMVKNNKLKNVMTEIMLVMMGVQIVLLTIIMNVLEAHLQVKILALELVQMVLYQVANNVMMQILSIMMDALIA